MDPPLDSLEGTDLFNMDLSFDQSTLDTAFDNQFGDSLLNQTFNDIPAVSSVNSQTSAPVSAPGPPTLESEWPFGDSTFDTNSLLDFSGTEDLMASFMNNTDTGNAATQNLPISQGNRMLPVSQPTTAAQHHMASPVGMRETMTASSLGMGSLPPNTGMNMATLQMLSAQ
ncbi:hypothetical protein IWQ62_006226, partial [Dispira parvispora]